LKLPKSHETVKERPKKEFCQLVCPAFHGQPFRLDNLDTERKEPISPQTRLDATFVHFDEHTQEWKKGIQVDPEKLLTIIKRIRENIANFKW